MAKNAIEKTVTRKVDAFLNSSQRRYKILRISAVCFTIVIFALVAVSLFATTIGSWTESSDSVQQLQEVNMVNLMEDTFTHLQEYITFELSHEPSVHPITYVICLPVLVILLAGFLVIGNYYHMKEKQN